MKKNPAAQKREENSKPQKISPARIAAFEILQKIEIEKAFSSVLLSHYEKNLETKDRALCHAITLGVLRKQIYLDAAIDKFIGKKLDVAVRIALRMGLYQLLFLDKIPAYSAINESVNLVQRAKKTSAKGLVNAVLRRAAREQIKLVFADVVEKIAVESSHPRWLIEKWIDEFGFDETEKLAFSNNETPKLVFRLTAKSDGKTMDVLKKVGLEIAESEYVRNAWKIQGSNEILRLYSDEGKIYFQEEASQIVAQSVKLKESESFLDVCAAPGSKTTYVAKTLVNEYGAKDTVDTNLFAAGDFFEHRVKNLKENCRNQAADFVRIVQYDAENALPFADESFDVLLIDAPCTGTGTIRHNPEIRYFLQPADFNILSGKQLRILKNASKIVKRGGRIIYSTCSLEREENEQVAEKFLTDNTDFIQSAPQIPERFLTAEGYARTFPQKDKTDGFFIAVFEKS